MTLRSTVISRLGLVSRPASHLVGGFASGLLAFGILGCGGSAPSGSTANLTILETSDLHSNILSYDYFKLAQDKSVGLERTATLIKNARAENPNTILLDGGDTIQGTVLADYQATVNPVTPDQDLAIYKVMSSLGYDAAVVGNHEFNFGLAFLAQVTGQRFDVEGLPAPADQKPCKGPNFPILAANVVSTRTHAPILAPYTILTKTIQATTPDGKTVTVPLKVGVLGLCTPGIMTWDKANLDQKVEAQGVKEAAEKYVPEMRAKGAEVVVVLSHGGVNGDAYSPTMENANYYLAQVKGIDAILMGHSHLVFPNAGDNGNFNQPGVDKVKGTIQGVPALMPGYWGKNLGMVHFSLVCSGSHWSVDTTKTQVEVRAIQNADKTYVEPDPTIAPMVDSVHQAAIAYVKTPIGTSDFEMSTFFADLGDASAVEVVNQAQAAYVQNYVATNLPQYASLPVLSVCAPFKSGFGGGSDYTDVMAGDLAINNAADLYLFPNTVHAVKVTGADIKGWMEKAANRFNQIDPTNTANQELISTFSGYNFDMFTDKDFTYEIDITQPLGSRIKNMTYQGTPLNPAQEFIVATNNYRASGGGGFPGLDGSRTIFASTNTNRDVLISHIRSVKNLTWAQNGSQRSWHFTPVATLGKVVFHSAQDKLPLARRAGLAVSLELPDDGSGKGLSIYSVNLAP